MTASHPIDPEFSFVLRNNIDPQFKDTYVFANSEDSEQTVQTSVGLLLQEPTDQGSH